MTITAVAENMEKEFLALKLKKKRLKIEKKFKTNGIHNKWHFEKKGIRGKAKISQIKKRLKTFGKLKTKFLYFKIKKF